MLTVQHMRLQFLWYKLYITLNLLPIDVDVTRGKIRVWPENEGRRWTIWKIVFITALLHMAFVAGRLIQVVLHPRQYLNLIHLPLHIVALALFGLSAYWSLTVFVRRPGILVAIFNGFFPQEEGDEDNNNNNEEEEGGDKEVAVVVVESPPTAAAATPVELFITYLPLLFMGGLCFGFCLYIYDPTYNNFLASVLVTRENPRRWFIPFFAIVDLFFVFFWAHSTMVAVFVMIFFQKTNSKVQEGIKNLSLASVQDKSVECLSEKLRVAFGECREMQLQIKLFHELCGPGLRLSKAIYLLLTILMITFGIRLIGTKPLYAGFYFYVGYVYSSGWIMAFDRAFKLPRGLGKYIRKIRLTSTHLIIKGVGVGLEYKRAARSFRLGKYSYMNRMSTPNFLRTVLKRLVKLLLSLSGKL